MKVALLYGFRNLLKVVFLILLFAISHLLFYSLIAQLDVGVGLSNIVISIAGITLLLPIPLVLVISLLFSSSGEVRFTHIINTLVNYFALPGGVGFVYFLFQGKTQISSMVVIVLLSYLLVDIFLDIATRNILNKGENNSNQLPPSITIQEEYNLTTKKTIYFNKGNLKIPLRSSERIQLLSEVNYDPTTDTRSFTAAKHINGEGNDNNIANSTQV